MLFLTSVETKAEANDILAKSAAKHTSKMTKVDDAKNPLLAHPPVIPHGESSVSSAPAYTDYTADTTLTEPYRDGDDVDDVVDLPPRYTDLPPEPPLTAPLVPLHSPVKPIKCYGSPEEGNEAYMDPRLDEDPEYLQQWLEYLAEFPPRPFIRIEGEHTETERKKDKDERKTVVDFDVKLELTAFLYRDVKTRNAWRTVRTVENTENVRRGTVLRKRAKGYRCQRSRRDTGPISLGDDGESAEPKPSLMEWCHRYCASHAGLKTFVLRRRVLGIDERWLKGRIDSLVRETGYRGRVRVSIPVVAESATIYSSGKVNELRLTRWVRWLFYLTLMFLFAWPYLFFRTKRFEVLVADWEFSRPVNPEERDENGGSGSDSSRSRRMGGDIIGEQEREFASVSEEGLMSIWARAIQKAVVSRRQGVLDQRDLGWEEMNTAFDGVGGQGVIGTVVGAMGLVQRQFGWGGDT